MHPTYKHFLDFVSSVFIQQPTTFIKPTLTNLRNHVFNNKLTGINLVGRKFRLKPWLVSAAGLVAHTRDNMHKNPLSYINQILAYNIPCSDS